MSATVNIRRDVKDAFYRYKMPKLQAKIEGKGNGIKTLVVNMAEIAKALHRPPAYVTKFFGAELGALTNWDEKACRYIVNGAHDAEKLQGLLDMFISKFVLCASCENPETTLSVRKDGEILRSCKACGFRGPVDMCHKLVTFIRTNPPPKPKQVKSGARIGEKEKVVEGMIAPEGFDEAESEMAANDEQNARLDDVDAAARKLCKAELNNDSAELIDPLNAFGDFLEQNVDIPPEDLLAEIRERDLRRDKAIAVVMQVLFIDDIFKALKSKHALLTMLVQDEKDQAAFLGSLDRIIGSLRPEWLSKMPSILQFVYSTDLVDEEALYKWRGHASKKYATKEEGRLVRESSAPFFDWLKANSSEEE